jgi:hypothetical protein
MRSLELEPSIPGEQRDVAKMVADTAASETDICLRSAAALAQVCRAVASDRPGRFDDLLIKAVVHRVMSASGLDVLRREHALDPSTPLAAWASGVWTDRQTASWLDARLCEIRRTNPAARGIAKALAGTEPTIDLTVAIKFDLGA